MIAAEQKQYTKKLGLYLWKINSYFETTLVFRFSFLNLLPNVSFMS
jgi:hypothetical protein